MVTEGHISRSICEDLVSQNPRWTLQDIEKNINALHRGGFVYQHYVQDENEPWLSEHVWVLPSRCHYW
jgi:hypothetical protein